MSHIAVAQEQEAPSAGAQEQKAPTAKMTGQDIEHIGELRDADDEGHDMMGHDMMGHGMRGHGMRGHGMMRMRVMMILMDTDGDGALSLEEVQTAHARIFKAIDADKDGKVTLEETQMFFRGGSPTSDLVARNCAPGFVGPVISSSHR